MLYPIAFVAPAFAQTYSDFDTHETHIQGAISIGIWHFYANSALNASISNGVSGGAQFFNDSSALNASVTDAISGGSQLFDHTSMLNATSAYAISGGIQSFSNTSALNALAANAIIGGTQTFSGTSALNATAVNALSGGTQSFYDTSTLNASAAYAISGGSQSFSGTSTLNALAANAVSGGMQRFFVSSRLNASAAEALSGGVQTFYQGSSLLVGGDNAMTNGTDLNFSTLFGGTGGTLDLNGFDTATGRLHSLTVGAGRVTNGGAGGSTLTIDSSTLGASTFSGLIEDGVGGVSLTKAGSGTFTLEGTQAYTGTTTVTGGTLAVNGSIVSSSLTTVANGGTLGGTGTIGNTLVQAGGILAPGNSIGTLTVDGDLTFVSGARFAVEVDPSGAASDLVIVTGTAHLAGGVVHIGNTGTYDLTQTYTILKAGALSGQFDTARSDFAFLNARLGYDVAAGTVMLELVRNQQSFASKAGTSNQKAVATGLDSLAAGDDVHDAMAQLPDQTDLIQASFDQLSGEAHATALSGLLTSANQVRTIANSRMRTPAPGPGTVAVMGYAPMAEPILIATEPAGPNLWSQAYGTRGHTEADGNGAATDRAAGGLIIGGDGLVGDWRLGILAGYGKTHLDTALGKTRSQSYHLGLYGDTQWGDLALRLGTTYSHDAIETSRTITIAGLADTLTADYGADTIQGFGELAYGFVLPSQTRIEPFANLAVTHLRRDGFTEQGGAAALTASATTMTTADTALGLRAEQGVVMGDLNGTLHAMVGWRHGFGDHGVTSQHAFAGSSGFSVTGASPARNSAVLAAGLDLSLSPDASLALNYSGEVSDRSRDHGFAATLGVQF